MSTQGVAWSTTTTAVDDSSTRKLAVPSGSGSGTGTGTGNSGNSTNHKRPSSRSSQRSLKSLSSTRNSPKPGSTASPSPPDGSSTPTASVTLYREDQRVSLRAFLRLLLQNPQIASSRAMEDFLTSQPVVTPNEEEVVDIDRRKALDAKRVAAQQEFYEFARKRARELDVYMEQLRQDIVERRKLSLSLSLSVSMC